MPRQHAISPSSSQHAADKISKHDSGSVNQSSSNTNTIEHYSSISKLSTEELKVINQLRTRDQEVRTHEQAHLAAAGSYANGGPSFTYQTGPDGKRYATGGEVSIDNSSIPGDPQATIQKARQIRRAALAPAQPSSADLQIAAQASAMEQQAQIELSQDGENAKGGPEKLEDSQSESIKDECQICGGSHGPDAHRESPAELIEKSFLAVASLGSNSSIGFEKIDAFI